MQIHTFNVPGISLYSYVVADTATQTAVVIDPPRLIEPLLALIEKEKWYVQYIFETHVHADFISGAFQLQQSLEKRPPIVCSAMGGENWIPAYATIKAQIGDVFACGHMRFELLHTPGHTPEHITYLVYDLTRSALIPYAAFTGDFLFAGSVGRPDLLGSASTPALLEALYASLFSTLAPLPDSLLIYPAHGADSLCGKRLAEGGVSTLGYERKLNPYLQKIPKNEWLALFNRMPSAPALFATIKKQNLAVPALLEDLQRPKTVSYEQLIKLGSSAQCLDVRPLLVFAFGHIPGVVNLPLIPRFAYWVTQWKDPKLPLYLIVADEKQLKQALEQLALIGIENVEGIFCMDKSFCTSMADALASIACLSAAWVQHLQQQQEDHFCLIDVRFEHEYSAAHIHGSLNIPLSYLMQGVQDVPKNKPLTLMCRTGPRASCGASILRAQGFNEVSILLGGIEGWKEAEFPVEGAPIEVDL